MNKSLIFKKYKIFEAVLANTFLVPIVLGVIFEMERGLNYFIYFSIALPYSIFSLLSLILFSDYLHYKTISNALRPNEEKANIEFLNKIKNNRIITIEKYKERSEIFINCLKILLLLQTSAGLAFLFIKLLLPKI